MTTHVGDLALLRLIAGELGASEEEPIRAHVDGCPACESMLGELRELDHGLRELHARGELEGVLRAPSDPFAIRPRSDSRIRQPVPSDLAERSRRARLVQRRIMEGGQDGINAIVSALDLERIEDRFGLLYALQEAGRSTGESADMALTLARTTIGLMRQSGLDGVSEAEAAVPARKLWGQAHVLAGQCRLWTKEFERAGADLRIAYREFGRLGDETGLAIVELNESQRRALAHDGPGALALATRARETFERLTLHDLAARALVAEGMAASALGRDDDAVELFRRALPVFEGHGLWANWVGTLNCLGTALQLLGRTDDARREYARALRRFSQGEHRSLRGFVLEGLANLLSDSGRHREAAIAYERAAGSYRDSGLRANALLAAPLQIESWARSGDRPRARHRLELLRAELASERLDASVLSDIERAIEHASSNAEAISESCRQAQSFLGKHLRG